MAEAPRAFFERLSTVGQRGGYGVVATAGADSDAADVGRGDNRRAATAGADAARIVGEASYDPLPNGDGELSMTVAADQRGWLGPYVLDALGGGPPGRGAAPGGPLEAVPR